MCYTKNGETIIALTQTNIFSIKKHTDDNECVSPMPSLCTAPGIISLPPITLANRRDTLALGCEPGN